MDNGWIKLHRKLLENPLIQKPQWAWLWVVLLLLASHKENKFMWNGNILVIKEGQFITGKDKLSKLSGISKTTIERILNYLEKEGQIGQQKTTKYRLITIVNWKDYQQVDNKRTTNGQQTDTIKNDNNDNNRYRDPLILKKLPEDVINELIEKFKCDQSQVKTKANSLFDYCEAKGKKYKNYKAFLSNALRKDFGERPPKEKVPIYEVENGIAKLKGYK